VTIEPDVWLGVCVTVLPAVKIGRGAIVAANSVVNKSIPAYEIWAGSPAKKVGERK
jgi:acetyltransferase-like isoleucine patch superfamily enzyme